MVCASLMVGESDAAWPDARKAVRVTVCASDMEEGEGVTLSSVLEERSRMGDARPMVEVLAAKPQVVARQVKEEDFVEPMVVENDAFTRDAKREVSVMDIVRRMAE